MDGGTARGRVTFPGAGSIDRTLSGLDERLFDSSSAKVVEAGE